MRYKRRLAIDVWQSTDEMWLVIIFYLPSSCNWKVIRWQRRAKPFLERHKWGFDQYCLTFQPDLTKKLHLSRTQLIFQALYQQFPDKRTKTSCTHRTDTLALVWPKWSCSNPQKQTVIHGQSGLFTRSSTYPCRYWSSPKLLCNATDSCRVTIDVGPSGCRLCRARWTFWKAQAY